MPLSRMKKVGAMSVLFARTVVVPMWVILCALLALSAPPFGATAGVLQPLGLTVALSALLAFMASAVLRPAPRTCTPQGPAVAELPSNDVDAWIAVVPVIRRALGAVVTAGARFRHVQGDPAAIQRPRSGSDVRQMVPSDFGDRSPGQSSRGLGGLRGGRGSVRNVAS